MNTKVLIRLTALRKIVMMLSLFGIFLLASCDELVDCIASATPELQSKQLVDGYQGSLYSETISAEVKNDPDDNNYDYYFDVLGTMPQGLNYSVNHRNFKINGIPTQTGTFSFKLVLRVDPPDNYDNNGGFFNDDDRICFGDDTTEKTYTIKIN